MPLQVEPCFIFTSCPPHAKDVIRLDVYNHVTHFYRANYAKPRIHYVSLSVQMNLKQKKLILTNYKILLF